MISMESSWSVGRGRRHGARPVWWHVLLPSTKQERGWWLACAVTVGVCEEFVYRGFLLFYLLQLFPQLPFTVDVALSSSIFGAAHLYQGWRGAAVTMGLGAFLAYLVWWSGSLVPSMIAHALIALRVLLIPGSATGTSALLGELPEASGKPA